MLQQEKPDDYVIATGVTHKVLDFVNTALQAADLPGDANDYVDFDQQMIRPSEVDLLVGDSSKAKKNLNWESKTSFEQLVTLMVENDLKCESKH